jgi:tetratricopeptide (TPR) repeat protein
MSRWWIGLFAAGTLLAQQNTPSDTSNRPTLRRQDGQSPPQAQSKGASGPQTDDLPPDEDVREAPKQYSFNPLQSKKEVGVGNFYFKKGDFKAAAGRFREATKWNDGNAEAWMRLGEAEERRENVKGARDAYRKFLVLQPDGRNAEEVKKRLEKLKG